MQPILTPFWILPLILASLVLVPNAVARGYHALFQRFILALTGIAFVVGLYSISAFLITTDPATFSPFGTENWPTTYFTFYLDGTAATMWTLVASLGAVVVQFSKRYLDGQHNVGQYYRWLASTLGSVLLLTISGNLILFFVAWVATSLSLHHLLVHFVDRDKARQAAWTKFAISRMGDIALLIAIFAISYTYGSLEFSTLFASAATSEPGVLGTFAAWLLVVGAIMKSAQFPFHIWLPETMETPTTVSALMHAGIVNAGGFLVIRLYPVIAVAEQSLWFLAVIGAVTAVFGSVVMLTQPSIKRSLAFSTIAQMGFMMLQCGLGALSAAMLHIVVHSLYKAHAFLSSGSTIAKHTQLTAFSSTKPVASSILLAVLGFTITTTAYVLSAILFGTFSKPGSLVLGTVLCLALSIYVSQTLARKRFWLAARGLLIALSLIAIYQLLYLGFSRLAPSPMVAGKFWITSMVISGLFAGLMLLGLWTCTPSQPNWLLTLRIHASNGFYVDAIVRRLFATSIKANMERSANS